MHRPAQAIVITGLVKHGQNAPVARPPEDRLALDLDQRASPHFTAVTEAGRKVHVSLPRGTELEDRDILTAADGYAVAVIAAEEDLITIHPGEKALDWATLCYQLGNLHRPLRVAGEEILTPRDAQVEAFLTKLGASFQRERRPFTGRKLGSVAGHHHTGHHHAGHP
ncbi:MAG: urease accessory protein UreE [Parvibaculaceae bacterium]